MAEALPGEGSDNPSPSSTVPAKQSPEAQSSGDSVSDMPDGVITASPTGVTGLLSEYSGSSDFTLKVKAGDKDGQYVDASYEGIIPPPNILEGYERLVPGSAKKIISWVADETKHRRELDVAESLHHREMERMATEHRIKVETKGMELAERAMEAGIKRANLGMYLAWPLIFFIIGGGIFLIFCDHDKAGTVLVTTTLTLVIGAYVVPKLLNKYMGEKEEKKKEDEEEEK